MRLGVVLAVAVLTALSSTARAERPWVIVSAEIAAPSETMKHARARAARALLALGKTPVELSAPPTSPAVSSLARQRAAQMREQTMVHVAVGENRDATMLSDQISALAEPSLAAWNQEDESARVLFDACLFALRAELTEAPIEQLQQRLARCRHLVPDLIPSPDVHPPAVLTFFEDEGRKLATASLSFRWLASPCNVRVQGRPASSSETTLVPGTYEVEVQCPGQRLRHSQHVSLSAGSRVVLEIDASLERARAGLALVYADTQERAALAVTHARLLASASGAERTLLISQSLDGNVNISLIDTESGLVLGRATDTLANLEPMVGNLLAPRAPARAEQAKPRAVPWAWGLSAGSIGLLGAGAYTYALTSARARELDRSATYPFTLQDQYHRARSWTFGLSAAAAVVGSSAVLLGFPHLSLSKRAHRFLFIGSLGAAALLSGVAALQLIRDERETAAVGSSPKPALSALLFAAATPFLTLSVLELIRSLKEP